VSQSVRAVARLEFGRVHLPHSIAREFYGAAQHAGSGYVALICQGLVIKNGGSPRNLPAHYLAEGGPPNG
jgi:hypothetical protein